MTKIEVYSVESSVPIPVRRQAVPLNTMEVGDSFVFPPEKRNSIRPRASRLKKETGKEFAVRKEGDNYRIWRTK